MTLEECKESKLDKMAKLKRNMVVFVGISAEAVIGAKLSVAGLELKTVVAQIQKTLSSKKKKKKRYGKVELEEACS